MTEIVGSAEIQPSKPEFSSVIPPDAPASLLAREVRIMAHLRDEMLTRVTRAVMENQQGAE